MLTYHDRYGYPYRIAVMAEFWWRLEHFRGPWQGYAYRQRKAWERRGAW